MNLERIFVKLEVEKTLKSKKTNDEKVKKITPEGFYIEKEMLEFLGKVIAALRVDNIVKEEIELLIG